MKAHELTIHFAQTNQPWTVPYSRGVAFVGTSHVPHILGSHAVLHAAKSVGRLSAVFENADHHDRDFLPQEKHDTIKAMSADLVTAALRLANLCGFDLASALIDRVREKNGITYGEGR